MSNGFTIARVIVAALLFYALAPHSYDYFTLMRLAVVGVSGYGAYLASQSKREGWLWAFIVILILFNPIFKMPIRRGTWMYVDAITGLFFLASIFLFKAKQEGQG